MQSRNSNLPNKSRRDFIRTGLTVAGGLALPAGFATRAFAADHPPIGTYPAGSSRRLGVHRHYRAAHRQLCLAGRG